MLENLAESFLQLLEAQLQGVGALYQRGHGRASAAVVAGALLLGACAPKIAPPPPSARASPEGPSAAAAPWTPVPTVVLATAQTTATPTNYNPGQFSSLPGINPLTGQPAVDPELLKIPAVLVSISHFPPAARPQAGLSFAPFVYEFSITGGETRFLAAFYGQFPAPEVPITGGCSVRQGAFKQTQTLLGGRIWLDVNHNGIQDQGEEGIPGTCVELLGTDQTLLDTTTTDSSGMYGFNVEPGKSYSLKVPKPGYLDFTVPDIGDDNADSDVNPSTQQTPPVRVDTDLLHLDAGMYPDESYIAPTPNPKTDPKPEVGPVRSGRLLYSYIGAFYQDSCLIYAFASPEVLSKIPHCSFVPHNDFGGGDMLAIDRLKAVAEDNMRHKAGRAFDYASNAYSDVPPPGGLPAPQINVYFSSLNQSGWTYDPLYRAYLRYVDTADPNARGVLHPEVDRLSGRQLHFENIIVIMADTDVITRSNIDIHLDEGNGGPARLFRDGRVFSITWSTRAGDYEKHTGLRRPIQFLYPDGSPAALKPGHTWVIIVTPFSLLDLQGGVFSLRYEAPAGEAQ
jgi:hypothetical protein